MEQQTAIIIGAGPAGLTAAYELVEKTNIKPIIYEMTEDIGGISKTVYYKGNRIDLGGHRFYSKSDRIMDWWLNILPLQSAPSKDDKILGRKMELLSETNDADPEIKDEVMLVRKRLSRIFFMNKFFDYPVSLNLTTLTNLGIKSVFKILFSYLKIRLFPIKKETSLEDFFINRFGKELYLTFFKDYTEKVWGVPCTDIYPEWGEKRVKNLSITRATIDAIKNMFNKDNTIAQKDTETTLIRNFLYPKFGPGQLWEEVAKKIVEKGGEIHMNHKVIGMDNKDENIVSAKIKDEKTGAVETVKGDYFFSTMPITELIHSINNGVPEKVEEVAKGLVYRDFITVGLLLNKLKIKNESKEKTVNNIIPDIWIYIQERSVKVGRLQIFNNWSPYLIEDLDKVWIGLEYFCTEGDELWSKKDEEFSKFAIDELDSINIIDKNEVLDSTVIRMKKSYPTYFGSYDQFHVIQEYTDTFENLFLIGRNGSFKYDSSDYYMLTAIVAVENIINNIKTKDNIWNVETVGEFA